MITCRELIEFLDDYVGDTLPADVRDAFEFHLKMCGPCRKYLRTYRKTIELEQQALGRTDAPAEPMPDDMVSAIVSAMKQTRTAGHD